MTPSPSPPHPVTPSPSQEWTLTARWLFPVAGPPLERGTVTIKGERVVAVEPHGRRTADLDFGNAAILPGLVNAHTHLDLSGMRGLAPPTPDFIGWLRQVIAHRRSRSPEQVRADVQAGLAECLRFGTTLIGDISTRGTSWEEMQNAPARAVVFREVLGLTAERAESAGEELGAWLHSHLDTATCRVGISPHAPYSVRATLIHKATYNPLRPVAIHLAESAEELELLEHRRGPFVRFLDDLGAWDPSGLVKNVDHVLRMTRNATYRRTSSVPPPVLFIHGNYLKPNYIYPSNGTIVYCPRTHAAFGHPPHPFREFLARGVRVALGTDSLASNPDLDLLAEARFLHARCPDVPGATVLRMVTLSGAEALGWQDETGSLEPGKSADLVVLPLPDQESADPHRLVLESARPVQAVLWRGRWRDPAGSPP